jgi:hypothetical protein
VTRDDQTKAGQTTTTAVHDEEGAQTIAGVMPGGEGMPSTAEAESGGEAGQSTEQIEQELQRRKEADFQQRLRRVLEVMRAERIDWRGAPFFTPDGRIAVRVVPIEMTSDSPTQ